MRRLVGLKNLNFGGFGRPYNTDKSKIIHFDNNESSYVLGTSTLSTVDEERDLGVIIDKTIK